MERGWLPGSQPTPGFGTYQRIGFALGNQRVQIDGLARTTLQFGNFSGRGWPYAVADGLA